MVQATLAGFSWRPWPESVLPDSSSASAAPATVSALWSSVFSRVASLLLVGSDRVVPPAQRPGLLRGDATIAIFAGCLDVTGTALFIRANQTGRLDSVVVLSSLYPALTVLLARFFLKEQFTCWKTAGILAAVAAVPLIALQ